MVQMCKRCRRANPREALYCYHDGHFLDHPVGGDIPADGSAINVGARPFTMPFVFPSGRACHNFLQLSLACLDDWAAAVDALRTDRLRNFLAGQGRADLALAAAAETVDWERGLDEFLGRLPVPLKPAKLSVERAVIDLGTVRIGEDRSFDLVLLNSGQRLVSGVARCQADWLSLGNGPAVPSRVFQFRSKSMVAVRIVGCRLRAFDKPQETQIVLESNGGALAVTVRISVPVKPFPQGILSGARSPRQLAHKAKDAPKEAAGLIASGALSRWYESNGWTYPVRGPAASGLAAVQQFLEALGLVKPPRVELSEEAIQLRGRPGEKLEYSLAVLTQENRAAIAHGTCDQPWLQVDRTVFRGRSAFLLLSIAAVPASPGATLQAQITVLANGGQRFQVPVTLVIAGAPAPDVAPKVVRKPEKRAPADSIPTAPTAPHRPPPAVHHANRWDLYRIVRGLLILLCLLAFSTLVVLGWHLWHGGNAIRPTTPAPAPEQHPLLPRNPPASPQGNY